MSHFFEGFAVPLTKTDFIGDGGSRGMIKDIRKEGACTGLRGTAGSFRSSTPLISAYSAYLIANPLAIWTVLPKPITALE